MPRAGDKSRLNTAIGLPGFDRWSDGLLPAGWTNDGSRADLLPGDCSSVCLWLHVPDICHHSNIFHCNGNGCCMGVPDSCKCQSDICHQSNTGHRSSRHCRRSSWEAWCKPCGRPLLKCNATLQSPREPRMKSEWPRRTAAPAGVGIDMVDFSSGQDSISILSVAMGSSPQSEGGQGQNQPIMGSGHHQRMVTCTLLSMMPAAMA
jgi:hypothetical protein